MSHHLLSKCRLCVGNLGQDSCLFPMRSCAALAKAVAYHRTCIAHQALAMMGPPLCLKGMPRVLSSCCMPGKSTPSNNVVLYPVMDWNWPFDVGSNPCGWRT